MWLKDPIPHRLDNSTLRLIALYSMSSIARLSAEQERRLRAYLEDRFVLLEQLHNERSVVSYGA